MRQWKMRILGAVLAAGLILAGAAEALAGSKSIQMQGPMDTGKSITNRGVKVRPEIKLRRGSINKLREVGLPALPGGKDVRVPEGAPLKSEVATTSNVQMQAPVDTGKSSQGKDSKVRPERRPRRVLESAPRIAEE
jgi:hypothetical protein